MSPLKRNASVSSRARREAGVVFEADLDRCHVIVKNRSLGMIEHLHPKVGGPPGRMFYREPAAVDYMGSYRGWPIAFDAKSVTDRTALDLPPWGENGADLKRALRQIEFLLDFYRVNQGRAVVFLLARCATLDVCWLIEPNALETLMKAHRVELREPIKRGQPVRHRLPFVVGATPLQMARGAPRWDYLEVAYQRAMARATAR